MKFWFIEDGEKQGPVEDYDLRAMIREGRISEDTRVWHEHAEGWEKASRVSLLQGEFDLAVKKVPEPPELPPPPILKWRRLGARWFDFLLYQLALIIIFRLGNMPILPDPDSPPQGGLVFLFLIPAVIMEGALLSSVGFTPGKWLMALKVTNRDGGTLSTGEAMMRSLRVWVLGLGMGIPLLIIFGHLVNLWLVKKRGAPLWDLGTGFRVPGAELETKKKTIFWGLFVSIGTAIMLLLWPEFKPLFDAQMAAQGK